MSQWVVFSDGRVLLRGRSRAIEVSIATFAGRIAAVGPRSELLRQVPPGVREVRLGGRLITPGLVDCHVHLLAFGIRIGGRRLSLAATQSLPEALDRVRAYLDVLPESEWIWGGRQDANLWPEGWPTRLDLDEVTGDRPAALTSKCGHAMWVNTAALRAAGITHDTPDPPGGRIERDANGDPTGILRENAMEPLHAFRPLLDKAARKERLLDGIEAAHAAGLVGVHNCEGPETLGALLELDREGPLRFRVVHHIPEQLVEHAAALGLGGGLGGARLRLGGVKAFADGSLGARSAAMLEPYRGTSDCGVPIHTADSLVELGRTAAKAGLPLVTHAIGDRAVREVLDALERLAAEGLEPLLPHRVEHAQHVHPDDRPRFAQLGAIASCQPVHLVHDMAIVERSLPDRRERAYALGSLLRAGAAMCLGSDAPIETIEPLGGIRAAVFRRGPDGLPTEGWTPEERLTVREALDGYTLGAAVAAGTSAYEGAIAPNFRADLTVLSHDIVADPESVEVCRVDMTVVDGEIVFDREGIAG